jgi:hypothetical protein
MFDDDDAAGGGRVLLTGDLEGFLRALPSLDREVSEAERVDQIGLLERVKGARAAAQARVTVDLHGARVAAEAAAGVPAAERARGLGSEVALARREGPYRGSRHLGLARAPVGELPHTLAALTRGEVSEWRVTLVARETATLDPAARAEVDAALAGRLAGLGDRATAREARALACRADPAGMADRARRAARDRRVTLRPAPDTMTYLTALLPVAEGVAAYTALTRHADTHTHTPTRTRTRAGSGPGRNGAGGPEGAEGAGGAVGVPSADIRTRGQVMADTLVERLTGQAHAPEVPVEVQLVMTDHTLLGGTPDTPDAGIPGHRHGHENADQPEDGDRDQDMPAVIPGHGPIPAPLARDLLATRAAGWLRRLYTHPTHGRPGPDGLPTPPLRRRPPRLPHRPRPHLPHPLVRRGRPAHRPRHPPRPRRTHHRPQRPSPLRTLQLHQGPPPLAHPHPRQPRHPGHPTH